VWNALFVPMAAKQRRKELGVADDGRYVDRLAFMLQACGDYDKVVQGCFEHYTHLKPLDTSFANICRLHDWVGYFDHLSNHIGQNMEFELMAYLPYAIVPWYSHFAAPSNAKRPIEWPKADYEASSGRDQRDCDQLTSVTNLGTDASRHTSSVWGMKKSRQASRRRLPRTCVLCSQARPRSPS
jgi:chromosome transmission fidelity protein 18